MIYVRMPCFFQLIIFNFHFHQIKRLIKHAADEQFQFSWRTRTQFHEAQMTNLLLLEYLNSWSVLTPFWLCAIETFPHTREWQTLLTENELISRSLPNFVSSHVSPAIHTEHEFCHVSTAAARHETPRYWNSICMKSKSEEEILFLLRYKYRAAVIKRWFLSMHARCYDEVIVMIC